MTAQALQVEEKKRGRSEGTVFRFSGRAAAFEAAVAAMNNIPIIPLDGEEKEKVKKSQAQYALDVSTYVAECTANGRPIEPAKLTALQYVDNGGAEVGKRTSLASAIDAAGGGNLEFGWGPITEFFEDEISKLKTQRAALHQMLSGIHISERDRVIAERAQATEMSEERKAEITAAVAALKAKQAAAAGK